MRIVFTALFALALSASHGERRHLPRRVAAAEPAPSATRASQPATTAAPQPAANSPAPRPSRRRKPPPAEPTKPKIWQPAVIHAESDDADSDGVAAVINDFAVSEYEVRQRMALFLATSGMQPNGDELKRIRGQILTSWRTRSWSCRRRSRSTSPWRRAKSTPRSTTCSRENHLTIEQLRDVLANAGSSEDALRRQLTAQLAWQKTVQQEYEDRINITPGEVDAELTRYAEGADKPHYLVSEIFFPVDNPDKDADALKDAQIGRDAAQIGRQFRAWSPISSASRRRRRPAAISAGCMKASWRRN